jgi:putative peptide zinc metalloprotease protein
MAALRGSAATAVTRSDLVVPGPWQAQDAQERGLPRLAPGTELAGEFVGAGYREPPHLVYREDGQVVQLPVVLYHVIAALERCHRRGRGITGRQQVLEYVARAVSVRTDRLHQAEHIEFLMDRKLAPLGVTTYSDGSPPEFVKSQPWLSLTYRMSVLSERSTWALAGLFGWLFRPAVLVATMTAILGSELWASYTRDTGAALRLVMQSPPSILIVVLLAVASTAFHEIGHGTACRYGGVRPGVTGCGVYVAWPVFYTDITNTYRLDRKGRLRTDLGGIYFNGLFVVALSAAYAATGYAPLLVGILSTNLEIIQQLMPTLRFDGYYIIADLVGIPDLFRYIGPILKRTLLRKPADPRLKALKRWPQMVITVWVLCIVPVLAAELGMLADNLPGMVESDWAGIRYLAANSMASSDPVPGVASAVIQIILLLCPLVGCALIAFRLLRGLTRLAWRRFRGPETIERSGSDRASVAAREPGRARESGAALRTASRGAPTTARPVLRLVNSSSPGSSQGPAGSWEFRDRYLARRVSQAGTAISSGASGSAAGDRSASELVWASSV